MSPSIKLKYDPKFLINNQQRAVCIESDDTPLTPAIDLIYTTDEKISLSDIKLQYHENMLSFNQALSFYPKWVNQDQYMILGRLDYKKPHGHARYEYEYIAVKMSKRGNDVYSAKVKKRFNALSVLCYENKDTIFLEPETEPYGFSRLLWITLTYNPHLCDVTSAWENVGIELNRFLSGLKQKFGSISVLRSFEGFPSNDYPHVHLLIYFKEREFPVYRYRSKKDGKHHYKLSNVNYNYFKRQWHSFISVEGVRNLGGIGYVLKYVTKEMYLANGYRTSALLWLFHKQSYSVSKDFTSCVESICRIRLVSLLSNSNNDTDQTHKWSFICTVIVHDDPGKWFFKVKPPPLEAFKRDRPLADAFNPLIIDRSCNDDRK